MDNKPKIQKVGVLKVQNGKYVDKNGVERTRYHEIGVLFASPHFSRICIKLHANGFGEGQFVNVFLDDDKKPNLPNESTVARPGQIRPQDLGFDPEEVPF